jgi:phosphoribosylanthranilate isomerase
MFRIKICGVTNVDDALAVVAAGADAIGLNFYAGSRRCVSIDLAAAIAAEVGRAVTRVGVFVDEQPATINQLARDVELDWVQLHGDERPGELAEIDPGVRVIRVYRFAAGDETSIAADIGACRNAGRQPDAVLIDAAAPGEYGGTGQTAPWDSLAGDRAWLDGLPLVLAGGISPANVAEAIRVVRPTAVDTASGVEASLGRKDKARVKRFVENAVCAFEQFVPGR